MCVRGAPQLEAARLGGVYTSHDGGETWQRTDNDESGPRFPECILVHPGNPDMLFAAQITGSQRVGSLFRKVGTAPWQGLGPQNGLPSGAEVHAIAGGATEPSTTLFIAVEVWDAKGQGRTQESGIYRSGNDGQAWEQVLSDPTLRIFRFACVNAKEAFAATTRGVLRTEDGGATWHDLSKGLPLPGRTEWVGVVPTTPLPTVYAGMAGGGTARCRRLPFAVSEYRRRGVEHYLCRPRMVVSGMRAHLDSAWSVESFPHACGDLARYVNLSTMQRDVGEVRDDLLGASFGEDVAVLAAIDEEVEVPRWLAEGWAKTKDVVRLRYRERRWEKRLVVWERHLARNDSVHLGGQCCGAGGSSAPLVAVQYLVFVRMGPVS